MGGCNSPWISPHNTWYCIFSLSFIIKTKCALINWTILEIWSKNQSQSIKWTWCCSTIVKCYLVALRKWACLCSATLAFFEVSPIYLEVKVCDTINLNKYRYYNSFSIGNSGRESNHALLICVSIRPTSLNAPSREPKMRSPVCVPHVYWPIPAQKIGLPSKTVGLQHSLWPIAWSQSTNYKVPCPKQ